MSEGIFAVMSMTEIRKTNLPVDSSVHSWTRVNRLWLVELSVREGECKPQRP